MEHEKPVLMEDILLTGALPYEASSLKRMLRDFLDNEIVDLDRLREACYPIDGKDPPLFMDQIIRVCLCRLRKVLQPGWEIISFRQGAWKLIKYPQVYNNLNSSPAIRDRLGPRKKD